MRRQNIFIITFILLTLTFSAGYAIFRTSATVTGKTAAAKDFNVVFYKVEKIEEVGSENAYFNISEDRKLLVINVPKLMYEGSYANFTITIKNTGALPAKLESIYEYGIDVNSALKVTYDGIGITDTIISPGQVSTFNVKVAWDGDLIEDYEELEFTIKLNYVQA